MRVAFVFLIASLLLSLPAFADPLHDAMEREHQFGLIMKCFFAVTVIAFFAVPRLLRMKREDKVLLRTLVALPYLVFLPFLPWIIAGGAAWFMGGVMNGTTYVEALLGDAHAQDLLAGDYAIKADYANAMKWYQKAADQGYPFSELAIGSLYANGHGVTQNYGEAMKWYLKAANQASLANQYQSTSAAQWNISKMYLEGDGVKKDPAEAAKWCELSMIYSYDPDWPRGNQAACDDIKKALTRAEKDAVMQRVQEWSTAHPK